MITIVRGLYLAAGGMLAEQRLLEAAANNLANATTPGYRAQHPRFHSLAAPPLAYVEHDPGIRGGMPLSGPWLGAGPAEVICAGMALEDMPGGLEGTQAPLDLALEGDGYFVVSAPAGEVLRRSGSLGIGPGGTLVDSEGNVVLGTEGPLILDGEAELTIAQDGTVSQGGSEVGRLRVDEAVSEVTPLGGGLYRAAATEPAQGYAVRQGYLEIPKGSVVRQMVALIEAFRVYEAGHRVVQAADDTLGWAVREVSALA